MMDFCYSVVRGILFLLCSNVLGYVVLEVCLQMVLFMLILVYTSLKQLCDHVQSLHCKGCTTSCGSKTDKIQACRTNGKTFVLICSKILLYTNRLVKSSSDGEIVKNWICMVFD